MSEIENDTFDPFDTLSGDEPEATETAVETEPEGTAEAAESEQHPDTQESETEQPETAEQPQEEPAKTVPLAALIDERKKRQALEAELTALKQPAAPSPAQPATSERLLPDPWDDGFPVAAEQALGKVGQLEAKITAMQTNFVGAGLNAAAEKLGDEVFNQTYETIRQNPQMAAFVFNHPDPRGAFLQLHENISRQQIASQIPVGMSLDDFVLQRAAELQAAGNTPAQVATADTPKPIAPPRSLASAPGTAGTKRPPLSDDPFDDVLS